MKIRFITIALFLAQIATPSFAGQVSSTIDNLTNTEYVAESQDLDVYCLLISIISNIKDIDKSNITMTSFLTQDLGMDSIDIIDLAINCEQEFKIRISSEMIAKWRTVSDVYDTVLLYIALS